jgi:hypothetical protein
MKMKLDLMALGRRAMTRTGFGIAGLALMLSACAGGGGSIDDQKTLQRRDSEKLQLQYDSVRGTYEGLMSNPATGLRPTPARLVVYVVPVQDGANSDGTPKFRPTLRARFRLNEAVSETDSMTLLGDLNSASGEVTLTSVSGTVGAQAPDGMMLSIRGQLWGGGAKRLELTRRGGTWGYFSGTRLSMDASAPAAGEDAENRERLLSVYSKIAGRYVGVVAGRGGERYEVEINLMIVERVGQSMQVSQPGLMAQYRRTDFTEGIGEKNLAVEYDSLTGAIFMRDSGVKSPTGPEGGNVMSITGSVINRVLNVTLNDRRGRMGDLQARANP